MEADPLGPTERNRIRAAAEFATAQTQFEKGQLALALRGFQRARFWDPALEGSLDKIVLLAFSLRRDEEAIRYALLAADKADPLLLRRLALYQTQRGEWLSALRLSRRLLAMAPDDLDEEGKDAAPLMLLLEVARLEYLTGDAAAASESFELLQRAVLAAGDDEAAKLPEAIAAANPIFWETAGRCHFEVKRTTLAQQAFEQMATVPDAQPRAEYWLAEIDAEQKPFEAYDRLKTYLSAGEDSLGAAPYELLARLMRRLNDQAGLETDLAKLAESGRPYAVDALAGVVAERGDAARAEELYRSQIERISDQSVDEILAVRAASWLIEHLAREGKLADFSLLIPQVSAALIDLDPLAAPLTSALEKSSQRDRLIKRLAGWSLDGRTAAELSCGAWVARLAGDFKTATKLHRAAVTRDNETGAERALAWGATLLAEDQPERAVESLRWSLGQSLWDDQAGEPHYYLANALALANEHEVALESAREAARRQPDSAAIAALSAWIFFRADRYEESARACRELVADFDDDFDPSTREALKEARLRLSYIAQKQGEADPAAEWLLEVLDEFPQDVGAKNDLAYLWAQRGEHLDKATELAEAAVAAEPDSAAYIDTLAWCQFRRGDSETALATIHRALVAQEQAGQPLDGEILEHRGDILAALGRTAEARKSWQEASKALAEENPDLAKQVGEKLKGAAEGP